MIGKLTGKVEIINPTEILIDVNGVGYEVNIPISTFEKIENFNSTSLFIHTIHREDQFRLFGFMTVNERNLFKILLDISGIGPAMAVSILSGLSVERLTDAVKSQNTGILTKIPGIGKSKAEKLIFELSRKVKKLEEISGGSNEETSPLNDAVEALMALGFDEAKASKCIDEISRDNRDITIEELIKEALKILV